MGIENTEPRRNVFHLRSEAGANLSRRTANSNGSLPKAVDLLGRDNSLFWGHLGLLQPGKPKTSWYPISTCEFERIWLRLHHGKEDGWLFTSTLNNRFLAFRPELMRRIWLLDDGCDAPEGDWEHKTAWNDYGGLPADVYRAISAWASDQLSGDTSFSQIYAKSTWELALGAIEEGNLKENPEQLRAIIHNTNIRLRNGDRFQYEICPDKLWESIQGIEFGTDGMFYLPELGTETDSFFSSGEVVLLDMPLFDVEDAARPDLHDRELDL